MTTATAETISQLLASLEPEAGAEAVRRPGVKTAGYCCPYVPVELILAHGMLPVQLPRQTTARGCLCLPDPAGAGLCGLLDALVVTRPKGCSPSPGGSLEQPAITLELPGSQDRYRLNPEPGREFITSLGNFNRELGRISGRQPNYLDIMRSILLEKRIRQSLRALYAAPLADNPRLTWRSLERLGRPGAVPDRAGFLTGLESLRLELGKGPGPADGRSRLMLYGPAPDKSWDEALDLIEASGGVVVTDYICTASARLRKRVPVWGTFERPLESLCELYLFNAPCPLMGGYGARLERMTALARWYRVHALVCLNPGSDPVFKADFERLSEDFYSRLYIPSLYIEDSLPFENPQGVADRLGGFIDIIGGRV